jgi:hypothetical protein
LIIAPTNGLVDRRSAENLDFVGLTVEAVGCLPLFQSGLTQQAIIMSNVPVKVILTCIPK